jgi:hypothetical protein
MNIFEEKYKKDSSTNIIEAKYLEKENIFEEKYKKEDKITSLTQPVKDLIKLRQETRKETFAKKWESIKKFPERFKEYIQNRHRKIWNAYE